MVTMEIDVTSSINNNINNNNNNEDFHVTNLILELQQKLSGMAKLVDTFFEMALPFLISTHGGVVQQAPPMEILIDRFKTFYSALTGLLECFNWDHLTCLGPIGERIVNDSFKVPENWKKDWTTSADNLSSNYNNNDDNNNNNSSKISPKESGADKEKKSMKCEGSSSTPQQSSSSSTPQQSSSSSPSTTITGEASTKKAERPKSLFTTNIINNSSTSTTTESMTSSSTSTINQSDDQSINQSDDQSINQFIQKANKHVTTSRKSSRRFVTTCVTGAEIAAAYQALAAATFRKSDFGRQEKTRHASFVSRGTCTPRKKEEFVFSFLTQSLPHLETGIYDAGRLVQSAPHSQSQQRLCEDHHHHQQQHHYHHHHQNEQQQQQQQQQTPPATRDASTSSDFIPRTDKGVQVRHGEILEPIDRLQTPSAISTSVVSKLDRFKRRQNSRVQLQKIMEDPDESSEDVQSKCRAMPFSLTSHRLQRRHTIASLTTPPHKSITCSSDPAHSDSKQTDELLIINKCGGNFPCFSCFEGHDTSTRGRRRDSPQPACSTIDYFFKQ